MRFANLCAYAHHALSRKRILEVCLEKLSLEDRIPAHTAHDAVHHLVYEEGSYRILVHPLHARHLAAIFPHASCPLQDQTALQFGLRGAVLQITLTCLYRFEC